MKRIRVTRWETSDGTRYDSQAEAMTHEKLDALVSEIRRFDENVGMTWSLELAQKLLACPRLIIALRPSAEGDR